MDDDLPGPPRDPRLAGLIRTSEATRAGLRRRRRVDELTFLERTGPRRARMAADILRDFGDPECPRDVVPSAELMREARRALRWLQSEAAWKLGFERRAPYHIRRIENGRSVAPRFARVLLMRALQDLDRLQRSVR